MFYKYNIPIFIFMASIEILEIILNDITDKEELFVFFIYLSIPIFISIVLKLLKIVIEKFRNRKFEFIEIADKALIIFFTIYYLLIEFLIVLIYVLIT